MTLSWAAIKVMTGEMTDRSNQDLAFSLLSMSYRLGQITGQLEPLLRLFEIANTKSGFILSGLPLGGLLAHPEQRFSWFRTAFWAEYPYLLPCLAGAAFAIFSIIPGVIFIEEVIMLQASKTRTNLSVDSSVKAKAAQKV